jgi:ribonuclease PH
MSCWTRLAVDNGTFVALATAMWDALVPDGREQTFPGIRLCVSAHPLQVYHGQAI